MARGREPGYVFSNLSSFRSRARTSAGISTAGAALDSFVGGTMSPALSPLSFCVAEPSPAELALAVLSDTFSVPFCCACGSLSANEGVATLLGVAVSSVSSMTNAASKTAGSGLAAGPSPLEAALTSSASFFLGRRAGDCVFVPLEDRERRVDPEAEAEF